jgi:hypothetical protein
MRLLDHSFDGTLTKYDGSVRKVAYMVLEYCDHSDMLYQLNLTEKPFSEDGVAHRDLKL